jgi:hypothetical protein
VGLSLVLVLAGAALGEEPATAPLPIPLTRPEMKQALEDLKARTPRIPLPELTEAEALALGERGGSYESRLRYHYLGGGDGRTGGGFGKGDPNATLDYAFKTEMFWIVSRANNCHY